MKTSNLSLRAFAGHVIIGLSNLVFGQSQPAYSAVANYLAPDAIDAANLLAPYPEANGTAAEIQHNLSLQASRTAADCARANSEVSISLDHFFGPANGPLTAAEVTAWKPLMDRVYADANYFVGLAKDKWKRPRPFQTDPSIQPCIPFANYHDDSYPSGHTTYARLYADILGQIDPTRRREFAVRSEQIGEDRVIGGVHQESDVQAGQVLADQIFLALLKSPQFINEVKQLQPAH